MDHINGFKTIGKFKILFYHQCQGSSLSQPWHDLGEVDLLRWRVKLSLELAILRSSVVSVLLGQSKSSAYATEDAFWLSHVVLPCSQSFVIPP